MYRILSSCRKWLCVGFVSCLLLPFPAGIGDDNCEHESNPLSEEGEHEERNQSDHGGDCDCAGAGGSGDYRMALLLCRTGGTRRRSF
jgi:hypothetical protein